MYKAPGWHPSSTKGTNEKQLYIYPLVGEEIKLVVMTHILKK
jgi:hypothetical protein